MTPPSEFRDISPEFVKFRYQLVVKGVFLVLERLLFVLHEGQLVPQRLLDVFAGDFGRDQVLLVPEQHLVQVLGRNGHRSRLAVMVIGFIAQVMLTGRVGTGTAAMLKEITHL